MGIMMTYEDHVNSIIHAYEYDLKRGCYTAEQKLEKLNAMNRDLKLLQEKHASGEI